MPGINHQGWRACTRHGRERGVYAVEFAIVVIVFLLLLFGVLELARSMYVVNTIQDVTRRAAHLAATANVSSTETLDLIRQRAVSRQSPGEMPLGAPITDQYVRIDFLALVADASGKTMMQRVSSVPGCPVKNRLNCMNDPNGASCIRFVRARICVPGDAATCTAAIYKPLSSLIPFQLRLPVSSTIVPVETLGYRPGMAVCP
jgi:hypothetical protein